MKSFIVAVLVYLGSLFGVYGQPAHTPSDVNIQNTVFSVSSSTAFIPDDERLPPVVTSPIGSTVWPDVYLDVAEQESECYCLYI